MIHAGSVIDIQSLPLWALWGFVALGAGLLVAVLFWMMPPALRKGEGGLSVALGMGLFLVVGLSASRATLWFGAVGFAVAALPLLWLGRLPADMPSARDPAVRSHPQYSEVVRRGRLAGAAIVALELVAIVLSLILVRGV